MDKANWPEGPWKTEIDKIQWVDTTTGRPCLIRRNHIGVLCGYVGVDEAHPFFQKDYGECAHLFDVHGDVTFSEFCADTEDDPAAICHIVEPGEPDRVWWFGFHCANAFDFAPRPMNEEGTAFTSLNQDYTTYRDFEYVKAETISLARQLHEITSLDKKFLHSLVQNDSE